MELVALIIGILCLSDQTFVDVPNRKKRDETFHAHYNVVLTKGLQTSRPKLRRVTCLD
jgi:hypothetical protein